MPFRSLLSSALTTMAKRTKSQSPTSVPTRRFSTRNKPVVSYHDQMSDGAREPSPLTDLGSELEETLPPPKKRQRRVKVKEPIVYDIPPVEHKTTTFEGRLGYACLNTILRAQKPDSIFCSRACRIETIKKNGLAFAKNLGLQNAADLSKLIEWNEKNKIKFMRISSEMFPFASHAVYGYTLDYAADELKAAGDLAKSLGHRMTLHPGQFTQIGSPKDNVVEASVRELDYHCSILRLMGMGKDSVMIIHMGGVYGDKATTLQRFKENYKTKLTDEMKQRMVLENDELCYSADDLLPVCEELEIPLVLDYHHNWLNPTTMPLSDLITRINFIWEKKGIKPKQHLSSPRPGAETLMEKRAHADRCSELPEQLPIDMDLMIEAKDKEQAVLHLYRIYGLQDVILDNLRPEKSEEAQKQGGKRTSYAANSGNEKDASSSKKKRTSKKKTKQEVDEQVGSEAPDEDLVVVIEETEATASSVTADSRRKRGKKKAVE